MTIARPDAEKRRHILTAAASVFARHGLHAARMDEIAQAAGVAKGTLYLYFSSKEAIIEALLDQTFTPEFDWLADLVHTDGSAYARLIAYTERSLLLLEQVQAMQLLPLLAEYYILATRNERARQILQHYNSTARRYMEAIFQQGIDQGEFRPLDPQVMYVCYATMLDGLVLGDHIDEYRLPLNERIRAAVQLLLDGFRYRPPI
ncbi:MAG: TetR/AcrR family transcriptional regulator [Chloroflexaceae bacterium]|nr:TetR/AcrR family transcriptional regulator [Chloroflexaceae bacterium]